MLRFERFVRAENSSSLRMLQEVVVDAPLPEIGDKHIENLIRGLDSLEDGEHALTRLISCGPRAIPYLERLLLSGPSRTVALPRRRAVRALGELGAHSTLIAYLRDFRLPNDAEVLFAEDGVRSDVARELLGYKTEEDFQVLRQAANYRATSGIIIALGEFQRPETVSLFFKVLEDDFCREDAKEALRKMPDSSRPYAILLLHGLMDTPIQGLAALRRRRATLQLLQEFGIDSGEWQTVREFLAEEDAEVVLSAASIGLQAAPESERPKIFLALFRVSRHVNWIQEDSIVRLLATASDVAERLARVIVEDRLESGHRPDWRDPSWRVLRHVLGADFEYGKR